MTPSQFHTFRYGENKIYYQVTGSGPPLILLHGWGSKSNVMIPLARKLSDIRTCYIPDLPGFGQSPPPTESWSVDDYADMLQTFIEEQQLAPVELLVHSFGGRIALKLCARSGSTDRIGKVLITAGAGMEPKRSWRYYTKKYLANGLKWPFQLLPASLRENALEWLRATTLWKKIGSSDYQQLSGTMREIFVKTVTEHLDHLLPEIPQETLLIWGTEDTATPLYQGKRMKKGMENAALVTIEGAGHYAFLDRSNHFVRIARAFFTAEQ
mgnify:CR=1 FL=1